MNRLLLAVAIAAGTACAAVAGEISPLAGAASDGGAALGLTQPRGAESPQPAERNFPAVAPEARDSAIQCLAQAIAYEAANEPEAGREAVAQVILNRVRHRAFPKTVCGVVYQGSGRRTGCQFTFTCDGSLRRVLSRRTWSDSVVIATAALDGTRPARIGAATHYHADYVMPRWAPALVRVGQIGAHIFYHFPGAGNGGGPGVAIAGGRPSSRGRGQKPFVFSVWGLSTADGATAN